MLAAPNLKPLAPFRLSGISVRHAHKVDMSYLDINIRNDGRCNTDCRPTFNLKRPPNDSVSCTTNNYLAPQYSTNYLLQHASDFTVGHGYKKENEVGWLSIELTDHLFAGDAGRTLAVRITRDCADPLHIATAQPALLWPPHVQELWS